MRPHPCGVGRARRRPVPRGCGETRQPRTTSRSRCHRRNSEEANALFRLGLPDLASFRAEDAHDDISGRPSSTYTAIERLADAEIVRALTDSKRSQVRVSPPFSTNGTTLALTSSGMREVIAFSMGEGGASWKTSGCC
jgi:hypothetical protein